MKAVRLKELLTAAVFGLTGGPNQTAGVGPQARTESGFQGQPKAKSDGDLRAVNNVVREIIAADNGADLDAVGRLYDDDAIWLPPHGEPIRGKNTILSRYRKTFERLTPELSFLSDETHVCGDWAFDRGTTSGNWFQKMGAGPST